MAGFLSKLTGGSEEELRNEEENFDQEVEYSVEDMGSDIEEISLGADLYEDEDNLFVKVFIAGVNPKELDMNVSRDILTISGERYDFEDSREGEQYIQRELSWGKFRKKILLPKEVDIELVDASIKYGVLTLKLPKVDKDRSVKITL